MSQSNPDLNKLTVETEDEYGSEKCVGEGGHFWSLAEGHDHDDNLYECERCVAVGSFE